MLYPFYHFGYEQEAVSKIADIVSGSQAWFSIFAVVVHNFLTQDKHVFGHSQGHDVLNKPAGILGPHAINLFPVLKSGR